MNKFKKIMLGALSVLTLGLFVVTGTRVSAATTVSKNETNTPSAVTLGEEYVLNASTVISGSNVTSDNTTVTDAYGIFKFSGAKWVSQGSNTYLVANGNKNAYITVAVGAGQTITYTGTAYCTKTGQGTYITLGGDNKVQTSEFSSNNTEKTIDFDYTNDTESSQNVELCFNNKLGFKNLTCVVSTAVAKTDYVASFSLNGGTGTAIANKTVAIDASDKTIVLPTTDATKTGYVFDGWDNGDSNDNNNPYAAGSNYSLTKDTNFRAVWVLDFVEIDGDFNYSFTSATGNGQEIIVESGELYGTSALKMQQATKINFKTSKSLYMRLIFTDYKNEYGVTVDGVAKTVDATTHMYEGVISAGTHIITRGSGEDRLEKIEFYEQSGAPYIQSASVYEKAESYVDGNEYYTRSGAGTNDNPYVYTLCKNLTEFEDGVDYYINYTYIRFITIIKGVEEISASDVTFSVTMDYADTSKDDKTNVYTPYVVKKITQNGETYTTTVGSASHTFDNSVNPTEYYVVYVLRFTTSKFSGNSIKATTTFGGTPYESNSITI